MKAKKTLASLAAATMVINGIPMTAFAEEAENDENQNPAPQEAEVETPVETTPTADETDQETSTVTGRIKFVNEDGAEIFPDGAGTEEGNKKYNQVVNVSEGYALFDLKDINGTLEIDEENSDQNLQAEYINDEDNKKVLVTFSPEFINDFTVVVKVTPEASEDAANSEEPAAIDESVAGEEQVASEDALPEEKSKATLTVNLLYPDGTQITKPWVGSFETSETNTISGTINTPKPQGYELTQEILDQVVTPNGFALTLSETGIINFTATPNQMTAGSTEINITYAPAEVGYHVQYYYQNVEDDKYTAGDLVAQTGKTGDKVSSELAPEKEGFYALNYIDTEMVAADGSTKVEVYYNRKYVLANFDLGGGYGVEPVYAKYGAPLKVDEPTRPGYKFTGWEDANGNALPETMPAVNTTYTAQWEADKTSFTVIYNYENADNDDYSYAYSKVINNVNTGSVVNSNTYKDNSEVDTETSQYFTYNSAKAENVEVNGDGTTILNVYFTRNKYSLWFGYNNNEKYYGTITAKFEQDISSLWPVIGSRLTNTANSTSGNTVPNTLVSWNNSNISPIASKRLKLDKGIILDSKNGSVTKFTINTNGRGYTNYDYNLYAEKLPTYSGSDVVVKDDVEYVKDLKYSQKVKYSTDVEWYYKVIPGYVPTAETAKYNSRTNSVDLYYKRVRSNLILYNKGSETTVSGLMYELPLSAVKVGETSLKDYEPEYPSNLPEGAYTFGGWYTTEECFEGTEVNLNEMTMPTANLILYAKWVPAKFTVTVHKSETHMNQGSEPHAVISEVPYGSKVDSAKKPDKPSEFEKYDLVGWFYKDEDTNEEKAFDFDNSLVTRNLTLYGKYNSNQVVTATIHYVLEDDPTVKVADDKTVQGLATQNKTEYALGGDALYEGYRTGVFPTVASTNISFDPDKPVEYTFTYKKVDKVPYTVKYLEKGTNKELKTAYTNNDNNNAVVTEYSPVIKDYVAEKYSETLVVSAAEGAVNEITFYYTEDKEHALANEEHYYDMDNGEVDYTNSLTKGKTETFKPTARAKADYELDKVEIYTINDDGKQELSKTVDGADWEKEAALTVGNGVTVKFYYAGLYYIHPNTETGIDTITRHVKGNDDKDITNIAGGDYLYAGLYKDAAHTNAFTRTSAGDESGKNIQPSLGKHYYPKFISYKYLQPRVYAIYNTNSKVIERVESLTATDDTSYTSVSPEGENVSSEFVDQIQITRNGAAVDTLTASSQAGVNGMLVSAKKYGYLGNEESHNKSYTAVPWMVTPDGIKVHSQLERVYNTGDGTYSDGLNSGSGFRRTSQRWISNSTEDTMAAQTTRIAYRAVKSIAADEPAEEPAVETTVNVTTVVNGETSVVTLEKGNVADQIADPVVEGSEFTGWYEDEAATVPADLTDVQKDITVYAGFKTITAPDTPVEDEKPVENEKPADQDKPNTSDNFFSKFLNIFKKPGSIFGGLFK